MNEPTLQIGAVAEQTGLSVRTLRHYEDVGLVRPSARSAGGFRLYTADDVARLLLIRRMKPLGFTLEEMGRLLATANAHLTEPTEQTAAELNAYVQEASARRDELLRQVALADEYLAQLQALGVGE
ncbi:MerR family transcriptional regulator [Tessaracoccus flavus]|uniref:MerR family transcriptional regulator n=1 Tax=Tessaracoccus flavus TaxID=1610493 RepID=A0A1Q2CII5_9ACTN|nr:MerR family transcriptional regulator [Tessaracoccus flavus]AQP45914.1 MerR family transcriptional regulator [Tessaracoccus flavus]SDZ05778.1 DNA-binding transcriptional regulator, MerR family [Tessaracoccus flavus]